MTDTAAILTLGYAFASAGSRGFISVIDRHQFGIRKKPVNSTNTWNNLAAAVICVGLILICGFLTEFFHMLFDPKVVVFGLVLQLTANAFSYAFKHMRLSAVTIASKTADIFIGPMIFLLFSRWSTNDFLFALVTFAACLPIIFDTVSKKTNSMHLGCTLLVGGMLVIQGALSPWYMTNVASDHALWLPFTGALVVWRLIFNCLFSLNFASKAELKKMLEHSKSEFLFLLLARAAFSLAAQAFLVLALSFNRPILAWPILNATGLIGVFLAAWFLKESSTWKESTVILLISGASIAKVFL